MLVVIRSVAAGLGLFCLAGWLGGGWGWALAALGVLVLASVPWTWRAAARDGDTNLDRRDWRNLGLVAIGIAVVFTGLAVVARQLGPAALLAGAAGAVTMGAAFAHGARVDRLARPR